MKSPTKAPAGPDDGPEEGEIVSDDFEDISDESMIFTPSNGKSLSRSDHLHALSLSSVTDLDESPAVKRPKRRRSYSQRQPRRRKRSRRKAPDSDSDDDTTANRKLKLQLKAAVRVDVKEAHRNNSLRTRLRAMVKGSSGPESDSIDLLPKPQQNCCTNDAPSIDTSIDTPIPIIDLVKQDTSSCIEILVSDSENALSGADNNESGQEMVDSASEQSKDEDMDSELMHLRIEALKTAINNKFANRRKRKKNGEVAALGDPNKENTSNNSEENQGKKTPVSEDKVEVPQISPGISNELENNLPPSPDEDEDVLRALLLASISKKITKTQPEPSKVTVNKVQTKMAIINENKMILNQMKINSNFKLNNNIKRIVNNVKNVVNKASGATKLIKIPQVKPLIINLNSDSDSDWDLNSSIEKSPIKAQKDSNNGLKDSKSVETVGYVIQNTAIKCTDNNVDTEIESTVENFLREQRAKVESRMMANKAETAAEPKKTPKIPPVTNTTTKPQIIQKIHSVPPNGPAQKAKVQKLSELEKSALKFLPPSKREEYKKLQKLLLLKKAQLKRPRIRRMSVKVGENSSNLKISPINQNQEKIAKTVLPMTVKKVPTELVSTAKLNGNIIKATLNKNQNNKVTTFPPKTTLNNFKNANSTVVAKGPISKTNLSNAKKVFHCKSSQTVETEHVQLPPKVKTRVDEFRHEELKAAKRELEKKNYSLVLRNTLKQLQTKKDGRLQIQEKYKCLRPLVKKLNEVSKEQKCCDQKIERLMNELAKARTVQEVLHRNKAASVKELEEEKKKIDSSLSRIVTKMKPNNILVTSTPIKQPVKGTALTFASMISNSAQTILEQSIDETKQVESDSMLNTTWQQSTIRNDLTLSGDTEGFDETEIYVVDPNDIDTIIKKTEEQKAVLESWKSDKVRYVSPLDAGQSKTFKQVKSYLHPNWGKRRRSLRYTRPHETSVSPE